MMMNPNEWEEETMRTNLKKTITWLLMAVMLIASTTVYAEADIIVSENTVTIGTEGFREALTIENAKSVTTLLVGQTLSLAVPEDYENSVLWSSTNKDVATVKSTGEVSAVGAGKTTVIVLDKANSANSASIMIEVIEPEKTEGDVMNILIEVNSYKGVYDGTEKTVDYKVSSNSKDFDPEKVELLTELPARVDCGIAMTSLAPEDFAYQDNSVQANFIIKNGNIWIAPKEVTVTVNDAEKTEGEEDPKYNISVDGLADADANKEEELFILTFDRDEGEEAGDYSVRALGDEKQGNYTVTSFLPGTLSILERKEGTVDVTIESTAGVVIWEGQEISLKAVIEDEDPSQFIFVWLVDKGSGWEEAKRGDEDFFTYVVSSENYDWHRKVEVYRK
jgi:hypothetical protein